jgi:acetyl-CoA synthetase
MRLTASADKVVIVDSDQRAKLDSSEDIRVDAPWRIVTVGDGRIGDVGFEDLLGCEDTVEPAAVGGDGTFIMIFTSGTTGPAKGVPTQVRAVAHMVAYMELGFDLKSQDVYWNAADPGWAYGLFYAIVAPLAMGHRSILLCAAPRLFSPGGSSGGLRSPT